LHAPSEKSASVRQSALVRPPAGNIRLVAAGDDDPSARLRRHKAVTPAPVFARFLDDAIETGLTQKCRNLVALREAEGVSQAALGVAQTYPFNPFVQVRGHALSSANNEGGSGAMYHYVLLQQNLQLAHQQQFS